MFRRKAYDKLLQWKRESQGARAVLIEGARRVGKSTLVEEFARHEYAASLVIDFSTVSDEVKGLFVQYRDDIDSFFMYLQAYMGVSLPRRESVVVFDEVQRFPPAREFVKQLVADGRYDYIETGSLISIRLNVKDIVIPSEERAIRLNPLDFEEFLWASGEEGLAAVVRASYDALKSLPEALHRKAERLFREYMLVGGMPQPVEAYLAERDFGEVDKVKRDILALYRNDIEKFGASDATRIKRVFSTLSGQLARHDRKFRLSSLDKSARGREYADAFFWLSDACISCTCYGVDDPAVGLSSTMDEGSFKCYMADTGLLVAQLFADSEQTPPRGLPRRPTGKARDKRGDVRRERRRPAARRGRPAAVLLLAARRRGQREHDGGRLPHLEGVRRRGRAHARVARRGEVDEALRHEVAREVQGEVRGPRGHAVLGGAGHHVNGGLQRDL